MQPNEKTITRASIYRTLSKLPAEEHLSYLMNIGLSQEDAEDFKADYAKRRIQAKEAMTPTGPFSQSETYRNMVESLKEKVFRKE